MRTTVVKKRHRGNAKAKKASSQRKNGLPLNVPVSLQQIIIAIKKMKKNDRMAFLEDLLAATSPKYLASIREAREDYRRGRVLSHAEVFAKGK